MTTTDIKKAVQHGFIDQRIDAHDEHLPKLLTNQKQETILNHLQFELNTALSFTFAVAFITEGGLMTLKTQLADLAERGIRGRIITSNYLNFNTPKSFYELMKLSNVDVRIINADGFHTKAFSLEQAGYQSIIIGSANLTDAALQKNFEWSLRVTSTTEGEVTHQVADQLDDMWQQAQPLSTEWIEAYAQRYVPTLHNIATADTLNEPTAKYSVITPNKMQALALAGIENKRKIGAKRALVISATGTGKTYLGAFDVQTYQPEHFLFIVHREQILRKSMESFQNVIGGSDDDFGILSGNSHQGDRKYVFATIQTLSRDNYLQQYARDHFDYIMIDETHKAAASSYLKVMDYFTPKFMLGLTATPNRTDDLNVYELFDYNIAYEITLNDALDENMLAPFHYVGVTDYEQNGVVTDDLTQLKYLVAEERVDYVVDKTEYYGYSGEHLQGLIFVSGVEEGKELAAKLTTRGFPSVFLGGEDSIDVREQAISKLANHELVYLITRDIFNEGIDIPAVNQVIMLRGTQSSIIFLQQLGRGLRKVQGKEYVTVIDFIGNYQNNYMIPIAFDQQHSKNKDTIRKDVIAPSISGVSTINFEAVAQKRIIESLNNAKLNAVQEFKKSYVELKNKIGRTPMLMDIYQLGSIDVVDILARWDSLPFFLEKMEANYVVSLSEYQKQKLAFLSKTLITNKRVHELLVIKALIANEQHSLTDTAVHELFDKNEIYQDELTVTSVKRALDFTYFYEKSNDVKRYGQPGVIDIKVDEFTLATEFIEALADDAFSELVSDAIMTGLIRIDANYNQAEQFSRYERYTRRDALKLLNWPKDQPMLNVGGYVLNKATEILPIFVTLDKAEGLSSVVAYEDGFINRRLMRWYSKTNRTLSSATEKQIDEARQNGLRIELFVKKSDDEGDDFYYIGQVMPLPGRSANENVPDKDGNLKKVVRYELELAHEVPFGLYRVITE